MQRKMTRDADDLAVFSLLRRVKAQFLRFPAEDIVQSDHDRRQHGVRTFPPSDVRQVDRHEDDFLEGIDVSVVTVHGHGGASCFVLVFFFFFYFFLFHFCVHRLASMTNNTRRPFTFQDRRCSKSNAIPFSHRVRRKVL